MDRSLHVRLLAAKLRSSPESPQLARTIAQSHARPDVRQPIGRTYHDRCFLGRVLPSGDGRCLRVARRQIFPTDVIVTFVPSNFSTTL